MKGRAHKVVSTNIADATAVLQQVAGLESQIEAASEIIADALLAGRKLLACGNGGSAADASHLTTEFVVRFHKERRPYPAISLTANGGDLTACGNDYSFDDVFSRQVRAFGLKGDVLFAYTTSGNSENVLRALNTARQYGVTTVAFLGREGGACAGIADVELIVRHNVTARIQEAHKLLLHTICELVELRLLAAAEAGEQPLT